MKKSDLIKEVKKIESVELLISKKMMLVSAKNFQVAMLAELWDLYTDDKKKYLCRNILTYCKVNNAFNQLPEKKSPILVISIKDSNDNVEPFAYFKNDEIEIIKNDVNLNPWIPVGKNDAPLEILELKLENGDIVRGHFTDKIKTTNNVFKFINVTHYRNIT